MLVKTFGSAVYGVEAISLTIEINWMATGKDYTIYYKMALNIIHGLLIVTRRAKFMMIIQQNI